MTTTPAPARGRPYQAHWLASILLTVAAVFCFILAALGAFGGPHISGASNIGLIALGLAFWALAGLA